MKVTVVVDNIPGENLPGEWGFCAYIEYGEKKILLDTGASSLFADNAKALGLSLADVDFAVLSHAHYDHGGGIETFFEQNEKAGLYLQADCRENCYFKKFFVRRYNGLPLGILEQYAHRLRPVSGLYQVTEGVYLLSHSTPLLEKIGRENCMYRKEGSRLRPDDFSHEQSLIIDTGDGLAVFNSCSHGGVVNIIHEVRSAFPNQKIKALLGGFHIFLWSEEKIKKLASLMKQEGIDIIYTGHCSKERGCRLLRRELGDHVHAFHVGQEITL